MYFFIEILSHTDLEFRAGPKREMTSENVFFFIEILSYIKDNDIAPHIEIGVIVTYLTITYAKYYLTTT